ncbi:MAG: hypothetical protein R8N23_06790 [Reichenbachiella sp.]|uniref:hypothetical protein n=1 Tax=Reichenbachiella sp. TaxID=2184521 RepID=UPI00296667A4|nr:hypothetical protein [Reichenbachiella sp.]MDW3209552.1 hypothetical protein [Reichenbachiella sp.]
MVTVIKKGTPIQEQLEKLNEVASKKTEGISASKYSGILKKKINPISYQSNSRDEWE